MDRCALPASPRRWDPRYGYTDESQPSSHRSLARRLSENSRLGSERDGKFYYTFKSFQRVDQVKIWVDRKDDAGDIFAKASPSPRHDRYDRRG